MMELSLKSKSIKKRYKKKKLRISESVIAPVIKPGAIDGVSNWMQMQKIIGPVKEKDTEKQTVEKMLKIVGLDQNSKGYKPPFSRNSSYNGKHTNPNSQGKCSQKKTIQSVQRNEGTNELTNGRSPAESEQSEAANQSPHKFNFNKSNNTSPSKNSNHEATRNKYTEKKLTKAVAMDCEMVGTGPKGDESIIARVSIVNSFGVCLYDEFVKPKEEVTDFRTRISGVRPSDLKKGKDLYEVQKDVLKIIEGRILVGHSIKHDLDVLFLSHPRHLIRDTAFYKPFRDLCGGKTPSLKKLSSIVLGCDIQSGEHSSVEDAQATMLLYLRMKKEWEKEVKSHRKRKPRVIENQMKT